MRDIVYNTSSHSNKQSIWQRLVLKNKMNKKTYKKYAVRSI